MRHATSIVNSSPRREFPPEDSGSVRKDEPTLIDINELSRRLTVAKGTLYNWVYLRRIPFLKAGRCLRFDYSQVLETLREYPIIDTSASGRRII
jgi:excisionase family DNA binding protein